MTIKLPGYRITHTVSGVETITHPDTGKRITVAIATYELAGQRFVERNIHDRIRLAELYQAAQQ